MMKPRLKGNQGPQTHKVQRTKDKESPVSSTLDELKRSMNIAHFIGQN